MGLLYGRAGRLTAKNGGFRPRRAVAAGQDNANERHFINGDFVEEDPCEGPLLTVRALPGRSSGLSVFPQ